MNRNENLENAEKKLIVMSQKLSEREFEELLSVIVATYLSDEGGILCEINEKGEVTSCKIDY